MSEPFEPWTPPLTVRFSLLEGGKAPYRGTEESAGWDLFARVPDEQIIIPPGEWRAIGLGIRVQPPKGYHSELFIRSSLSKRGLRLTTGVSVIDADYLGEIIACVYNDNEIEQVIHDGDRICQLVFRETLPVRWIEGELDETERGEGGFGSTGRR